MTMMNDIKKLDNSTVKGDEEWLDDLPPLEGEEEKSYSVPLSKSVKEGKRLKILTPSKLLARVATLLA